MIENTKWQAKLNTLPSVVVFSHCVMSAIKQSFAAHRPQVFSICSTCADPVWTWTSPQNGLYIFGMVQNIIWPEATFFFYYLHLLPFPFPFQPLGKWENSTFFLFFAKWDIHSRVSLIKKRKEKHLRKLLKISLDFVWRLHTPKVLLLLAGYR